MEKEEVNASLNRGTGTLGFEYRGGKRASVPLSVSGECRTPSLVVCKCEWRDYIAYHIMTENGDGHVRVSFFKEEVIISDLFVNETFRRMGIATRLLDKVDELLGNEKAVIYPLEEWQREWYERRGYIIGEDVLDEDKLTDEALGCAIELNKELGNTMTPDQEYWYQEGYKEGVRKTYR